MILKRRTAGGEVRYKVRLRRPDGREYAKTFRTRREAVVYESGQRAARSTGSWVDPTAGKMPFGQWADEWLATSVHTWRPRTADKHRMAIEVHWSPRFGRTPLKSISTAEVQKAVNELAVTHASSSVRTYYGTLRSCLKYAVERELIVRSPCRSIKLPAISMVEKRVVTPHEMHRLADAAGLKWRCFIYLGGVMGLRFGEAAALRRSDVDLDAAELSVVRALVEVDGKVGFDVPKSRSSVRSLPLPHGVVNELRAHIAWRQPESAADLLFLNGAGKPLRRSDFRNHVFLAAVRDAGVDGLTYHGLRHSAATQWVASGVDLRTVQSWLGHADPQLVLRLYAHASAKAGRASADLIGETFWSE